MTARSWLPAGLAFAALLAAVPAVAAPELGLRRGKDPDAPVTFAQPAPNAAQPGGAVRPAGPARTPAPEPAADKPSAPLDLAYGAYQRGYYLTALREATARLDKNPQDAAAMTLLGELYNQGLGVGENPQEAARWYLLAAKLGDRSAISTLGLMATDGRGVPKDYAKARAWLEQAAAMGEPTACYNLARLLITGGGEEEIRRGAQFLKVAAEAELGDAQYALGVLYQRGQGVLKNPEEAGRLFQRAARNGSIVARVDYAIMQFNGVGMPKDEAAAARNFIHAALQGNAIAQNRAARLYAQGRGVPKNLVEAAAWNLAAAAQGLSDTWLDDQVKGLDGSEKARAEALASFRANRL